MLHPTDLSWPSHYAFVHALKIALIRRIEFEILHVNAKKTPWHEFPAVRRTLEHWGVIEPGTERREVSAKTGVAVAKVAPIRRNALKATIQYVTENPKDLLVLATEGREKLARWFRPSFAERLVRATRTSALFVPANVRGFVSPKDGSLSLPRVLVPVDTDSQPAIDAVARIFRLYATDPEQLVVAHAEPHGLTLPNPEAWPWEERKLEPTRDAVVATANEIGANLIVIMGWPPTGLREKWRGSFTERLIRRAPCPVLVIPTTIGQHRRWSVRG